jgi:hypothetical protein
MNCQFCDKSFQESIYLQKHQKTKACLLVQRKIQESLNEQQIMYETKIKYLDDELTDLKRYHSLELETQRDKFEANEKKITTDFNDKIQNMLLQQIETLASKPTATFNQNNNKTINLSILDTDKDSYEKFFKDNIHQIKDIDTLTDQLVLKFRDENGNLEYACTDQSRNIFKYKDENNVIQKDPQAKKLISIIQQPYNKSMQNVVKSLSELMNKYVDQRHKMLTYDEEITEIENEEAEALFNQMFNMRNLSRDETQKEFCKKLGTKCTI